MIKLEKIINYTDEERKRDKELARKIKTALGEINRDIYSLFIHPVATIKNVYNCYAEMFRERRAY